VLDWGAREAERVRHLPGDDLLPNAAVQTTRAVTIEAGPRFIWPWLLQMGPKPRAGAYTYAWIERLLGLDIENSDRILPQFQHLEVGDFWPLNEQGAGLRVVAVEAERWLVLQWEPTLSTWAFALYPESGGRTRLLSRNRIPGSGLLFRLGMLAFMEPGSLIMEREMLRGLKRRAERLASESSADGPGDHSV
jgi:hypothetical protein